MGQIKLSHKFRCGKRIFIKKLQQPFHLVANLIADLVGFNYFTQRRQDGTGQESPLIILLQKLKNLNIFTGIIFYQKRQFKK